MSDYYMRNEKELQDFVNREVIYCVSSLIYEMMQGKGAESMIEGDFENLYQGPPSYGEYTCPNCDHQWEDEPETYLACPECSAKLSDEDNYRPTEYQEVLEHWIVTDWLADRLEEQGEAVCKDFYGLTIWGRTTSGQGIALDGVISQIHKNLHGKY